jgi:proteic killer suppression protein
MQKIVAKIYQFIHYFLYFDFFIHFKPLKLIFRGCLIALDAAFGLQDLKIPPSNKLEALKGKRKGQFSIRINDQWRICFTWKDGDADDVEIIDYH